MKKLLHSVLVVVAAVAALGFSACSDSDDGIEPVAVGFTSVLPDGVNYNDIYDATLKLTELNTGAVTTVDPLNSNLLIAPGLYNYEGTAKVNVTADGNTTVKTLRTAGNSVSISSAANLKLNWFFTNPGGTLIFSEIYAAGSPNAAGTSGLKDSYFRIYNNTDQTIYADGIGIAESSFTNAANNNFEILTPANDRETNFTAQTIWVIPGNGTEHPILPGQSIKIVDQAIDWSEQVAGALNHTDADFEWYDDHKLDTDNPSVPNLNKWYSYSATIWIMNNQCNKSYALVKFPEGMTAENYLASYNGTYTYIGATGKEMTNSKSYLIPLTWIIDGVNLGTNDSYENGALSKTIDISHAAISDITRDPKRFGKKFVRKVSNEANGVTYLQDTNDSAADFYVTAATNK